MELLKACRSDRRAAEGSGSLTLEWGLKWIEKDPDLKKKFDKEFGSTETRAELIDRISNDPAMEKELEQRVIDKWEAIENEIKIDRKRKYQ